MSTTDLAALCWPATNAGEALQALARAAGIASPEASSGRPGVSLPGTQPHAEALGPWLHGAAAQHGLEAESLSTRIGDIDTLLLHAGPALRRLPMEDGGGVLLILPRQGSGVRLLSPDGHTHRLPVQALIDRAAIPPRRQARVRVRAAMMREHVGEHPLGEAWLLRLPPTASFITQLKTNGAWARLRGMLALFAALYALELPGWGLIGRATLEGHPDTGWWLAWALLMLTLIPMCLLGSGRVLKARLMTGALNSDLGTLKQQGSGSLLALVMESQALESLAAQGGFSAMIAVLELMYAAVVLMAGADGLGHVALLAGWMALGLLCMRRFHVRLSGWTATRLGMTRRWVEQLVGHRSRLVQAHGPRHHRADDEALNTYATQSQALDDSQLPILTLLPRGWLLIGLLGLAPALMRAPGHSPDATGLALSLGGLMLA